MSLVNYLIAAGIFHELKLPYISLKLNLINISGKRLINSEISK